MEGLAETLAVTWHDPPWKPWGIRGDRIRGCRDGAIHECIAEAVQKQATRQAATGASEEREILKALASKSPLEIIKGRAQALGIAHCLEKKYPSNCPRRHEIQAALIPATISIMAEAAGDKTLKSLMYKVIDDILSVYKGNKVHRADVLASSLDRYAVRDIQRTLQGEDAETIKEKELVILNPFDPRIKKVLPVSVDVNRIAEFIISYTLWFMRIWKAMVGNSKRDRDFVVVSLAALIIEPLWYKIMGKHAIPPADTRIPTHTVFDHIHAALAAYNWASDANLPPKGCLVLVDLKGVQSWISESRQLRDLWASSWLASLLAWKAVEPFVEEYGVGVLISPPARLHPFLAARLLNLLKPGKIGEKNWKDLAHMLGLRYGFPLDPTVPATYTLALPPEACMTDLGEKIGENIAKAWREVSKHIGWILAVEANNSGILGEGLLVGKDEIERIFEKLEPPLAFETRIVKVEEAYNNVEDIIEKRCHELKSRTGLSCKNLKELGANLLYFQHALGELHEKKVFLIKVAGRRAGVGYAWYSQLAWDAARNRRYEGGVPRCTVCGKAPAIVDGKRARDTGAKPEESLVLRYVREDRLCPHCLVKRMVGVKDVLDHISSSLGLVRLNADVEKRLTFYTIDLYTSRVRLKSDKIIDLTEQLSDLGKQSNELEKQAKSLPRIRMIPKISGSMSVAPEKEKYLALAVEASVDDAEARKVLDKIPDNMVEKVEELLIDIKRARRKSAILRLDGDFMGKRVHRGLLGFRAIDYFDRVLNFEENHNNVRQNIRDVIVVILEVYQEANSSKAISVPVTPSYEFSLSRSLALQAAKVRDIVEEETGILVYTGGDDVIAVLPPVDEENGKPVYPALRAAWRIRLAYWGLDGDTPTGFHVYRVKEDDTGGDGYIHVSPATVAYGLSGSLLFFDVMVPFWTMLRLSLELEEAKDKFAVQVLNEGKDEPKDVLVLASDSAGAAPLPRSIPGRGKTVFLPEMSAIRLLEDMGDLLSRSGGSKGRLSTSIIGDYLIYRHYARELVERGAYNIAEEVIVELLCRNLEDCSSSNRGPAWELARKALTLHAVPLLGGYQRRPGIIDDDILKVKVGVTGTAGDMLEVSGFHIERRNDNIVEADLLSLIFLAAKILKGTV